MFKYLNIAYLWTTPNIAALSSLDSSDAIRWNTDASTLIITRQEGRVDRSNVLAYTDDLLDAADQAILHFSERQDISPSRAMLDNIASEVSGLINRPQFSTESGPFMDQYSDTYSAIVYDATARAAFAAYPDSRSAIEENDAYKRACESGYVLSASLVPWLMTHCELTDGPRIVAVGDSWFRYPDAHLLSAIASGGRLGRLPGVRVNLAESGKTLLGALSDEMELPETGIVRTLDLLKPDFLFVSFGGNDILMRDTLIRLVKPHIEGEDILDSRKYIHMDLLDAELQRLDWGFRQLLNMRNATSKRSDVVFHTYGRIVPGDRPARVLLQTLRRGPWVYPVLNDVKRIPIRHWAPIADYLLDRVACTIRTAATNAENTLVVETIAVLDNHYESGRLVDWADEIHPSRRGYCKLWSAFMQQIEQSDLRHRERLLDFQENTDRICSRYLSEH